MMWGSRRVVLSAVVAVIVSSGAWSPAPADFRASVTGITHRLPEGAVTWRPGAWRLAASASGGRGRFHVVGSRWGAIDSWAAGNLAVRWGRGASGFPAAPRPGVMLSGATSGGGIAGAGLQIRAGPGLVLVAAGLQDDLPIAFLAWRHRDTGLLVAGRPVATRVKLADPVVSWVVGFREPGQGGEIELAAGAGAPPEIRAQFHADMSGLSGRLDLRLPAAARSVRAARNTVTPRIPGARRLPVPTLELELRAIPLGIRTLIGTRAALPYWESFDPQDSAASRSFFETSVPLRVVRAEAEAKVGADFRPASGREGIRLHTEFRTSLSRAALDVTSRGGVLARVRTLWSLPGPVALEFGIAAWSGPVAGTGALADLPAIPEAGLTAPLGRPGQAAGLVMSWQLDGVRVKLGASSRQLEGGQSQTRSASRVDLVLPEG